MALACKTLANLKFKQGSSLLKNSSIFQGTKRGLQTESFIQKARRLKERSETKFSAPEDTVTIGNDVYGLNAAVNWSFVEHGIVPEQKAFRNLNLRRSIGFSSGKADKEKTITLEIKTSDFPKYVVGENLSDAQFDALYKQATLRMGEDKDVFMQDGAVGSHRWAEVKTRVLTDDGNTALLAKHLLTPTKIYKNPRDYRFEAVIVATSHLTLRNPGDFGLKSGPFIAVNRKTKRAIIAGSPSSATLIDAIGDVASNALLSKLPAQTVSFDSTAYSAIEFMEKQKIQEVAVVDANKNVIGVLSLKHIGNILDSVEEGTYDEFTPVDPFLLPLREQAIPLSGDAILHSDKKNTTVVVSHNGHFLQTKPSFSLFGAHNVFWSASGLVHAWQGVNYPHSDSVKLSKGNVIEKLPNNKAQSTVPLNVPNAVPHPQNLVFLVSDTKSALPTIGKLDATQATQFFTAGYNGNTFQPFFSSALSSYPNPAELTQFFKKQVEEKKPNVFVVNSTFRNKEMSSQDLHKVISAIVDGSATKASSSKGGAFSALSSVQGVPNLESGNSSKLEQEMSAFLKSKFPNVTF